MLLELEKAATAPHGLFDEADSGLSIGRMRTVDALNTRFGQDTVTFGTTARPRAWRHRISWRRGEIRLSVVPEDGS